MATKPLLNLPLLVLARICTTAIFMTYPACLNLLLSEWQMSAAQGGLIQGVFTICFALSLLATSFLCDHYGARKVFVLSCAAVAISALAFALFADSFWSAMWLLALIGLAQGGTYTPSIMLVSVHSPDGKKSSAIGWAISGMSAGYIISIFLSTIMLDFYGYQAAFIATASFSVLGWILGVAAMRNTPALPMAVLQKEQLFTAKKQRRSRLLTLGYIGHSWELMGMWAWMPAFLAATVVLSDDFTAIELGLWTALALHLSGAIASLSSGYAAEHYGIRPVLIFFAALGLICSLSVGWLYTADGISTGVSLVMLFAAVAVYGFSSVGDSAVMSSAMAQAVPAQHLGKALGLRSILGMGAGALAPISFGVVLDVAAVDIAWGLSFVSLGMGGLIALVCAFCLAR
ncbi:MAG: MFS transporter [Oceanospirillaceae bacterium]